MIIKTSRFGDVEINEDLVFDFIIPIIGYEDEKKFVLFEHSQSSAFRWLQSINTPELAFAVTSPTFFAIDYTFDLPDFAEEKLKIESAEDLLVLNVAAIPHGDPRKTTINLLAPIIMNMKNKYAGQVILSDTNLSVSHPLFNDDKEEAKC